MSDPEREKPPILLGGQFPDSVIWLDSRRRRRTGALATFNYEVDALFAATAKSEVLESLGPGVLVALNTVEFRHRGTVHLAISRFVEAVGGGDGWFDSNERALIDTILREAEADVFFASRGAAKSVPVIPDEYSLARIIETEFYKSGANRTEERTRTIMEAIRAFLASTASSEPEGSRSSNPAEDET